MPKLNGGKELQTNKSYSGFWSNAVLQDCPLKLQVLTYRIDYRSADTAALCGRTYNIHVSNRNILNSGLYTQELKKKNTTPYWDCDRKDINAICELKLNMICQMNRADQSLQQLVRLWRRTWKIDKIEDVWEVYTRLCPLN